MKRIRFTGTRLSGYPKTKTIVFDFVADAAGLATRMTAGDVDIAFRQLSAGDHHDEVKYQPEGLGGAGAFIQYLCMQQKNAPFNNVKIREAVAAAINPTTSVDRVPLGECCEAVQHDTYCMFGHTDAFQAIGDPNYTRTRELLASLATTRTTSFIYAVV